MSASKKRQWNSDKALSLLAIFLSLGTLIVFLYQTNLIKKQQYASVLPYLEMGQENTGTDHFVFAVENKGVGPAIIEDIEIKVDGKPFKGSHVDILRELYSEINDSIASKFYYSSISPGTFIPSGGRIELIEVIESYYASRELANIFDSSNLSLKITYKSIYDETWSTANGHLVPIKLD